MNNRELIDHLVSSGIPSNTSDIVILRELEAKFGHIGIRQLVLCALEAGYCVTPRRESMLFYFTKVI